MPASSQRLRAFFISVELQLAGWLWPSISKLLPIISPFPYVPVVPRIHQGEARCSENHESTIH